MNAQRVQAVVAVAYVALIVVLAAVAVVEPSALDVLTCLVGGAAPVLAEYLLLGNPAFLEPN